MKQNRKNKHRAIRSTPRSAKKTHHEGNFSSIMKQVVQPMPLPRRLFSRFIHVDSVHYLSGFLGATIARPNAILFGAICSFLFTLTTYLLAKNYGYSLSGFETIGAFLVGWTIGILFDLVSWLIRRK